jgi:lipopolysaccharide export system ATP-binding protein
LAWPAPLQAPQAGGGRRTRPEPIKEDAPMPLLQVEGLVKTYGNRRVVDGVSFSVEAAEIVGLLGPNGAGKTTSFRMTCGMIEPDEGQVVLQGREVTTWPMYRRAREGGMGYLAQESSVFRKLTVEQNLLGVMELLGFDRVTRRRRCEELLEQFGIARLRKSRASSLSGGERRRLEIARCLVSNPEIILLDEPFTGIDPVTIENIQKIIQDLKARGISILITDHQVRETLQITDRSYVIVQGQVLCHGTPQQVTQHPKARELYFGSSLEKGLASPSPSPSQPAAAQGGAVPPARSPAASTPTGAKPRHRSVHEEETLRAE